MKRPPLTVVRTVRAQTPEEQKRFERAIEALVDELLDLELERINSGHPRGPEASSGPPRTQ